MVNVSSSQTRNKGFCSHNREKFAYEKTQQKVFFVLMNQNIGRAEQTKP